MNDAAPPVESPAVIASRPLADPAARPGGFNEWLLRQAGPLGLLIVIAVVTGVVLAVRAEQRVGSVERALVGRQHAAEEKISEAGMVSREARDGVRDAAAKVALLEARLNEVTVQRTQLEELIQSLARSRDENVVAEVDAAIRVALQQTALTGSVEPLVAALKQSDERLGRANQPRLEAVRRAIARDLDRVKAVSVADIPSVLIKLDEAVRMVDELPLLSAAELRRDAASSASTAPGVAAAAPVAPAASASAGFGARQVGAVWNFVVEQVWNEAKSLVRVTRIERPDAMLIAPEQSFFLRENIKLRLLNARLALLSRQFDTAQGDLQVCQAALARYFDRNAKRTQLAAELLRQVAVQARQVSVPRPDDALAALAAVATSR